MIRFVCSNCRRLISVGDENSGRKGKCPKCESIVVVPEKSTVIVFPCASCGHKIKVPAKYGGKKGECPKCNHHLVVPPADNVPVRKADTAAVSCPMCGNILEVSESASDDLTECPECGSYIESQSESGHSTTAEPDASIQPDSEEESYQEEPEAYEESTGMDRRLIAIISAVAAVVVVGLVVLVVVLRSSGPKEELADTRESSTELQIDQAQEFAERYIGLLEAGEIDQALQLLTPELASDAGISQVESLSQLIGASAIIEMQCARTLRLPDSAGDQVLLEYNLRCEEGSQTVVVSVIRIEQELMIKGASARNRLGRTASVGPMSIREFSRLGTTAGRRSSRPSSSQFFFALAVGFAVGTGISAGCLWIGMKLTNIDGTFAAMVGIAAISSLAGVVPSCIGLMPCMGSLLGLIVMFVLICQWTDADFWPDAVALVLVAGLINIVGSMLLRFLIAGA